MNRRRHPSNDEAYWLYGNQDDEVPDDREPEDNIPDAVMDYPRHSTWRGQDGWSVTVLHSSDGDPLIALGLAHPLHHFDSARRLAKAILDEIETHERERAGEFDQGVSR